MQLLQQPRTHLERSDACRTRREKRHDIELLKKFLVRGRGASLKFHRLKLLDELSVGERVFAAILREDADEMRQLLMAHPWRRYHRQFWLVIDQARFSGLIIDSVSLPLMKDAIVEVLQSEEGEEGRAKRWLRVFLKRLHRRARKDLFSSAAANASFARILAALGNRSCEPIWIKGIALSHSVYPRVEYRTYSDFDCFVPREYFKVLVQTAKSKLAYDVISVNAGFCTQFGVGPTSVVGDLLVSPDPELVCANVTTLTSASYLPIDLKLDPLNRGLLMVELERFKEDSEERTWQGKKFRVPSTVDSLLIALVNLVDANKFEGWRSLYDVHVLVARMSKIAPSSWNRFIACCKTEGVSVLAWAGLAMAVDRFDSVVPDVVLEQLRPRNYFFQSWLAFTVNSEFVWNANSMPMLLLSAMVQGNLLRKMSVLQHALFPRREFLRDYYEETKFAHPLLFPARMVIHWLIMFLPGGIVRHLFGHRLWNGTQMKV